MRRREDTARIFLGGAGRSLTETTEERKRSGQDGKHVSCPLSNEVKPMKQRGAFVLIELRMVIATRSASYKSGNGLFLQDLFSPILGMQMNDDQNDGKGSIEDGYMWQP